MSRGGLYVARADHGAVVVLTLNRPERRNALGRELVDGLSDVLGQVEIEPSVRAVVISGAGDVFCAGLDLKEDIGKTSSAEVEASAVVRAQAIADLIAQIHQLSKPTIAAMNGDALAGGAGLASACDFVIAAGHARIGYPEVRRGLVASIVMHDLIHQVGERRARVLLLTGQPISVVEAERWGLVNRVVPASECLSAAIALGQSLVECGPVAIETTKRLIAEAVVQPIDLRGAAAVTAQVRVSEEAQEGIRAFLERRPPEWTTRGLAGESVARSE